ncbi:hypothetical protein BJ546DRAFT_3664 [Cryomyces antarcticus]
MRIVMSLSLLAILSNVHGVNLLILQPLRALLLIDSRQSCVWAFLSRCFFFLLRHSSPLVVYFIGPLPSADSEPLPVFFATRQLLASNANLDSIFLLRHSMPSAELEMTPTRRQAWIFENIHFCLRASVPTAVFLL